MSWEDYSLSLYKEFAEMAMSENKEISFSIPRKSDIRITKTIYYEKIKNRSFLVQFIEEKEKSDYLFISVDNFDSSTDCCNVEIDRESFPISSLWECRCAWLLEGHKPNILREYILKYR